MIRAILLILLLSATSAMAAQKWNFSDPRLNDEFDHNYNEHRFPKISTGTAQNFTIVNASFTNANFYGTVGGTTALGKVFQVATGNNSTTAQKTSTAYSDTGLTKSITLSDPTHRVLVLVSQATYMQFAGVAKLKLVRDSTDLRTIMGYYKNDAAGEVSGSTDFIVSLDAPGGIGPFTYKTQYASSGGNPVGVGGDGSTAYTADIVLIELSAS